MISISPATPGDVEDILAIKKQIYLQTYPNQEYGITREDILSKDFDGPEQAAKLMSRFGGNNRHGMWVAKDDDRVVGYCAAEKEQDSYSLSSIYILPEYQRRGIGELLLQKALSWLGNERNIVLEVAVYNVAAIEFYKKFGFTVGPMVKPENAYILPSGKVIPCLEMTREAV